MYLAGLLNFMPLMVAGISVFCLWSLIRHGKRFVKNWTAGWLVVGLAIAYMMWYSYGGLYADGDTMTHWGVVVREICELNRLPNFTTTEVAYQSYPTGSAGYIYFVCKIIGYSDGSALFAQGILVMSLIMTCFAWVQNRRSVLELLVFSFFACFALHFNIALDDLKVDNILALMTIASLTIFFEYQEEPQKACILCAPVLTLMIVVKNSALFWWLFAVVPMLFSVFHRKEGKRACVWLCVAMPLVAIFLWNCHTGMVFADADASRHSTSIKSMVNIYHSKSYAEIMQICINYFRAWFSLDKTRNASGEWWALFGLFGVFACSAACHRHKKLKLKQDAMRILFVIGGYVVYKIMLLGMYIFNMPDSDALIIGAYSRYVKTYTLIIFAMTAIQTIFLIDDLSVQERSMRWKATSIKATAVIMLCLLPITLPQSFFDIARPNYRSDGVYRRLELIRRQCGIPEKNAKVLVYTKTPYAQFYVTFCFRSIDAWCVDVEDWIQSEETTPDFYDYLIVLDHDEQIDDELLKRGYSTDANIIYLQQTT